MLLGTDIQTNSPKQFKSKFGGLKNLRANEWKVVIKEIRKRKAEGKGSYVYLNGRKLDPGRVIREMRRYSGDCDTVELIEKDTSIGLPPSIYKYNLDPKFVAHNALDIAIDSHTQNRIEIRTPSPSTIQSPMINGSLARHILPEELSIQQSHTVGPQMEFTDGPLFLDPGLDLDAMDFDAMDFDINTAGVDDQAFRFSVTELPSTILDMSDVPPSHPQQSLPFHCRYPFNPSDSTFLVSSPTFRGAVDWQDASLPSFYYSPGRRPFLKDKHAADSLAI
jgi:hypothetical protein